MNLMITGGSVVAVVVVLVILRMKGEYVGLLQDVVHSLESAELQRVETENQPLRVKNYRFVFRHSEPERGVEYLEVLEDKTKKENFTPFTLIFTPENVRIIRDFGEEEAFEQNDDLDNTSCDEAVKDQLTSSVAVGLAKEILLQVQKATQQKSTTGTNMSIAL